jgi:hypothetical protein
MDTLDINELASSLQKTIVSNGIEELALDLGEPSIDTLIQSGLLNEIPILATLIGVGKTIASVRDLLFLKKIIYFLSSLDKVPVSEREMVIKQIESSNEYSTRVGEKLLFIIDKCDDPKSAELVAKLFSALLKKEITYTEFLKSSRIVNDVYITDLKKFVLNERDFHYRAEDVSELLSSGLFDIEMEPVDVQVSDQDDHKRSNEKYQTRVDGGTLLADISSIGKKIKTILKPYFETQEQL